MPAYTYNGIFLQYCKTLQYSCVAEYDPSGTDVLYYKHTIRVRGFLSTVDVLFPGQSAVGAPDNFNGVSALILKEVKSKLETPRRPMEYIMADQTIVKIKNGDIDAKLGPHPLPAVVTEVTSGLFMVECGCEVCVVECDTDCKETGSVNTELAPGLAGGGGDRKKKLIRSNVLSLRWTQTETFDENHYSRLSTRGLLIVRSDFRLNADASRSLCVPVVLPDYKRVSSRYTLSPDGLNLEFQFEDQEFDRLPPYPATVAEGTYTVTSEFPGFKRVGNVHLRLEGQKGTSRKLLMIKAINMAYSKLRSDGYLTRIDAKPTPPIIWGQWKEDLFKPAVEVSMQALMTNLSKNGLLPKRDGGLIKSITKFFEDKLGPGAGAAGRALVLPGLPAAELGFELGIAAGGGGGGALLGGGALAGIGAGAGGPGDAKVFTDGAVVSAALAAGLMAADGLAPVPMMPSVGRETDGLKSGLAGIKPPDRKRLSELLVAAFRDPCACLQPPELLTETKLRSVPTFTSNPEMRDGVPVKPDLPSVIFDAGGNPVPGKVDLPTVIFDAGGNPVPVGVGVTPAVIKIGAVRGDIFDAEDTALTDDAPYDTYQRERTVSYMTGLVHLPGTGTGSNGSVSKVVSAHGPKMTVMESWTAGRSGKPPVLPALYTDDPNLVPLDAQIVVRDVKLTLDGGDVCYMSAGFYRYAVLDPRKFELVAPVAPFYDQSVKDAARFGNGYWETQPIEQTAAAVEGAAEGANPFILEAFNDIQQPVMPAGFLGGGAPVSTGTNPQQPAAPAPVSPETGQPVYYNPPINA